PVLRPATRRGNTARARICHLSESSVIPALSHRCGRFEAAPWQQQAYVPEARAVLVRRFLFSFSRSCCPAAATTRSRPLSFASYKAASALSISDSGVSPWLGHSATPTLTPVLPPATSPSTPC